jgi:hypothetical protein
MVVATLAPTGAPARPRVDVAALERLLPRPPLHRRLEERADPTGLSRPPDPGTRARGALYKHPDLGNIYAPKSLRRLVSVPGRAGLLDPMREVGLLVMVQKRPIFRIEDDGTPVLLRYEIVQVAYTHNERVDAGAAIQANRVFGTTGTTANGVFTAVAVANAALTKTKTDLSLGSATGGATTNEFTTLGLVRIAGTVGTYTAPSSLGGTFSQVISKLFTATGGATAKGSGLFDSTTASGSNLYVEDNHTDAVLVTNDTLTESWTITN